MDPLIFVDRIAAFQHIPPSFWPITGIHQQNNPHEWHQPGFHPTAPKYREHIDGDSNEDEDQNGNANEDDNNDKDGSTTDPKGWTNTA